MQNQKKLSYKSTLTACYIGYITQAIVVNFVPILFTVFQDEFHLSFSELGNLVLINFVVQIITDIVSAKYVDKIGFRKAAIPAHILCASGLIGLFVLPNIMPNPYAALVISTMIYAFGGGMIEVVVSPIVVALPSDNNSAAMSLLHSFYCWGQLAVVLLTTLALKIFGHKVWGILSVFWALIPIINTYIFTRVPLPKTNPEERHSIRDLLKTRAFLTILLLMAAGGAAAQVMAQWSSLFAQKGLMTSKLIGDFLGPCMFAFFMGIGRMLYGIKGEKLNLRKSLLACSIMCIICYFISALSLNPWLSLAGCALTGFAVSLMWPGMLSFSSARFPNGGAAMFGVLAIFGDIGCSVGPWLTGIVSDSAQKLPQLTALTEKYSLSIEQIGLKAGILIGIIFPVTMLLGLISLKNKNTKNS